MRYRGKLILLFILGLSLGAKPLEAQLTGGGGGSAAFPPASGAGQCLVSSGAGVNYVAGSCGSGNLPALGAGGTVLFQNASGNAATWVTCSGDATCSAVTPGAYTVVAIRGNAVKIGAPTDAQIYVYNAANTDFEPVSLSGDLSITNAGVVTVANAHLSSPLPVAQGGTGSTSPTQSVGTGLSVTGSFPAQQFSLTAPVATALGGTGTTSTLAGIVRGGSPMTASELSGDVTTSGSNAATVSKVNGAAVPTSSNLLGSNGSNQLTSKTNLSLSEAAAPVGASSTDILYPDSTAHRWKMINNNGTAAQVVASGVDVNTSDQVTASHFAAPLSTAQGGTGSALPGLTAGNGLSVSGTFPTQQFTLVTPVTVANGGTQCPQTSNLTFSGLPASPAFGTTCAITDCVSGVSGTTEMGSGTIPCEVTWMGSSWLDGGVAASSAGSGSGVNIQLTNDVTTGTSINRLTSVNSSNNAVLTTAGATSGIQGICIAGCSRSGNATIQTQGSAPCYFHNGITAGDYAQLDAGGGTNGDCFDAGTSPSAGSELVGTIISPTTSCTGTSCGPYNVNLFGPDIISAGGSANINAPTEAGNPMYYSSTAKTASGVPHIIHAGTGTLAAAFAQVPQFTWAPSTGYTTGSLIYDSGTNTTQRNATASCTSGGGSHPTWSSSIGSAPSSGADNTCNWIAIAFGAGAPSVKSVIYADPNQSYTVSSALLIGIATGQSSTGDQTLVIQGASIQCTNTNAATSASGNDCLVAGNKSHIVSQIGFGNTTSTVGTANGYKGDAVIESMAGYLKSRFSITYIQPNMDVQGIVWGSNTGATTVINKGALWISSIEGQGMFRDLTTTNNAPGSTALLVDDFAGQWNELQFSNVYVGQHLSTKGVDIECGTNGGQALSWYGGAITDSQVPSGTASTYLTVNGLGPTHPCYGIFFSGVYMEGSQVVNTNVTGISINDSNFWGSQFAFNGGGSSAFATDVSITGQATNANGLIHVDGYANNGTTVINDAWNSPTYTNNTIGGFSYNAHHASNATHGMHAVTNQNGLINTFGPGLDGFYYSHAGTQLPACSTSLERNFACVSDASGTGTCPNGGTTYSVSAGAGSSSCMVECNNAGSNWVFVGANAAAGVNCY